MFVYFTFIFSHQLFCTFHFNQVSIHSKYKIRKSQNFRFAAKENPKKKRLVSMIVINFFMSFFGKKLVYYLSNYFFCLYNTKIFFCLQFFCIIKYYIWQSFGDKKNPADIQQDYRLRFRWRDSHIFAILALLLVNTLQFPPKKHSYD